MVSTLPVYLPQKFKVTDEQFWEFSQANPELRMECTADGEIIVMSPTESEGGNRNAEATTNIAIWNRQTRLGKVFDSSTGFRLPNGATRSPDTCWIANERWDAIPLEQRKRFAPICPDFVLELASESDTLDDLRQKMREYIDNGCRLGWLISPKEQQVEIYRCDLTIEVLQSPAVLSGEDVLPGLVFSLSPIFELEVLDGNE
jgi:Uma2 family endonuclease